MGKLVNKKKRNIFLTFLESVHGALTPAKSEQAVKGQQAYRSFRAKAQAERRPIERIADNTTAFFGSISFAILHVIWFAVWILINTHQVPSLPAFDPYPFGLLTTIVSLEAIFLSVFVLISQNREAQISDMRQELDFQINMQAEQEITKTMSMVSEIYDHLGLKARRDKELQQMMKPLDAAKLEEEIKVEQGLGKQQGAEKPGAE